MGDKQFNVDNSVSADLISYLADLDDEELLSEIKRREDIKNKWPKEESFLLDIDSIDSLEEKIDEFLYANFGQDRYDVKNKILESIAMKVMVREDGTIVREFS